MNRKAFIWTVALTTAGLLLSTIFLLNPLHWSKSHIKDWVLRKAPLGSSVADVKALIERQGWKLDFEWEGTDSHASPTSYPYVKGGHIIGAYFGHYQGVPWRADVDAFWGFDDEGKLIDFHVRKDYDAP